MARFEFPVAQPVVRNGQAVVELVHNGEVVGEINFTKIMANWFDTLGVIKRQRRLTVVP
jgi:hypothetical protein